MKKKEEKKKRSKNKGSHKPSRDDLLPNFGLALRVNAFRTKHQDV